VCDCLLSHVREKVQGPKFPGYPDYPDYLKAWTQFRMSNRRVLKFHAFHEKGKGGGEGDNGWDETSISGQTWLDRPFLLLYRQTYKAYR
jgi:hypothetical protein